MIASAIVNTFAWAPSIQQLISDCVTKYIPDAPKDINWLAIVSVWVLLGFVVWALWDLSSKLQKHEDDYNYALSFDGFQSLPDPQGLHLAMILSNTYDKPIEFKMDMAKTYLDIDGKRITPQADPTSGGTEGILYKSKPRPYVFPQYIPLVKTARGRIYYELVYGPPGKPLFRRTHEIELSLERVSAQNVLSFISLDKLHDVPIK